MNTATANIEEEKRRAIAEIDHKAELQREHQLKLGQLTKAVTNAETALVEFEGKKSFLQARKQQLLDQLLQLWPQQASDLSLQPNTSPIQCVVECHGTILAIDAALADSSRVKKHLDSRLHATKQRLVQFQHPK